MTNDDWTIRVYSTGTIERTCDRYTVLSRTEDVTGDGDGARLLVDREVMGVYSTTWAAMEAAVELAEYDANACE